ncbi:MAG TPA: hypothetical protein VK631_27510, partial [Solirubrobacteraceae bacterium]|nr:hypothetical protein [Solirubrobacteraceae bacterium]
MVVEPGGERGGRRDVVARDEQRAQADPPAGHRRAEQPDLRERGRPVCGAALAQQRERRARDGHVQQRRGVAQHAVR